jgi:hypothetical protein
MKKSTTMLALACMLCATVAPTASARKRHRPATWGVPEIFSNLVLDQPTGDVGGMEVVLVPAYNGWWATVVTASGVADDPVLVPVTWNGNQIEFTLPGTGPGNATSKITGKISPAGLMLRSGNESIGLLFGQSGSRYR